MLDLKGYGWLLWDGVQLTVMVSVVSMVGASVVGMVAALARLGRCGALSLLVEAYTTVVRGIPELVLLLLVYYGAPTLVQDLAATFGHKVVVSINPFAAGIATITFIYGAFASEVFRAAYLNVPAGQHEAAAVLGLSRLAALRLVILPQLFRYALPGLGNVWMVLVKATALISVIQLPELMRNADVAARATRMPFTFFLVACLIYLAITLASMWGQARAEGWASRGVVGGRL
ncbi:amino acid ABC transporter membrane protein 1, PAAT family [Tistlia consotensis]|uniref:Amino acid ABC transporter membrane protein 1, PAAT family n=1 Tax=Tistlia consotensis USBA 355 TaxID=560819 RepID=A0A1Y6CKE9_9PROT|nr:ABC transporter permease subunit [Tistlia consotensis]SMF71041.1 amino acid ABC transporter membrane protein 1, PAAT family [Tistlia consotensis USBA 355]SNS06813.1 amino acid ABC transporter membrane protein 1, PAAT family [Tistlia consotensis]